MARGFGFAQRAREDISRKKQFFDSVFKGKLRFKLDDKETAKVRFIEFEDELIYGAWFHEVPREGRAWGDLVPCIAQDEDGDETDEPCPGCEHDLKMKERFFVLVVWEDAPVYARDSDGKLEKDRNGNYKVEDEEDQVAFWEFGPQNAEELEEIEESYGLLTRDFRIKRKGVKTDTKYMITEAKIDGGKSKIRASWKKLADDHDIDLNEFIKPPSYEEFEQRISGGLTDSSDNGKPSGEAAARTSRSRNPFKKK